MREQPDWDHLRTYFEAGYSFQQLAAMPEAAGRTKEAVRQKAKKDGWARDATERFRLEARERLAIENEARRRAGAGAGLDGDGENHTEDGENAGKLAGERADSAASAASAASGAASGRGRGRRPAADEAVIADFVAIGRRQMMRAEELHDLRRRMYDLLMEYLDEGAEPARRKQIHMLLLGRAESAASIMSKLAAVDSRLMEIERSAWNMDAQREQPKRFLPRMEDRRGVPGFDAAAARRAVAGDDGDHGG